MARLGLGWLGWQGRGGRLRLRPCLYDVRRRDMARHERWAFGVSSVGIRSAPTASPPLIKS